VSRFFPRLADRIAAKKVREVFKDEIAARNVRLTASVDQKAPSAH